MTDHHVNVANGNHAIPVIGDIHGHADELVQLLEKLGYRWNGGEKLSNEHVIWVEGGRRNS